MNQLPCTFNKILETSCDEYLEFLRRENAGYDILDVVDVNKVEEYTYLITLSKNILDSDNIEIRIDNKPVLKHRYFLGACSGSIIEFFSVDSELIALLESSDYTKLKFYIDLQFLVRNMRDFYASQYLFMPTANQNLRLNELETLISDSNLSTEQAEAVRTSLSSDLSYIWGPPGTGKTKYVLATCVNYLLKRNETNQILITAPTNVALDQSLIGVLDMLPDNSIPPEQIIRLGNPTQALRDRYPYVCEQYFDKDKQKQIQQLKKLAALTKQMHTFKRAIEVFNAYTAAERELSEAQVSYDAAQAEYKELKKTKLEIESALNACTSFLNSALKGIKGAVRKFFINSKYSSLNDYLLLKVQKQRELEEISPKFDAQSCLVKEKEKALSIALGKIKQAFTKIDNAHKYINKHFDIALPSDITQAKEQIEKIYNVWCSEVDKIKAFFPVGSLDNEDAIKAAILNLHLISGKKEYSTMRIIACTLDRLVAALDNTFNPCHVFLDEAGYTNIAKAMSLFCFGVPITLLGDHMQLPPVCELNDKSYSVKNFHWGQSSIYLEQMFNTSQFNMFDCFKDGLPPTFETIKKSDLNKSFRFGDNLASVLDKYIYKNGFCGTDGKNVEMYYINAPNIPSENKRVSVAEIEAIKAYLSDNSTEQSIVLTPYKNQVKHLKESLNNSRNIMTVHKSQGQEWETVIFSVVDTTNKFFTNTKNTYSKGLNLVNTCVSRAKNKLIIVCDYNYWINQEEQLITDLLKISKEYKIKPSK